MTVKVECDSCEFWDERKPSDLPYRCPQCAGHISRATNPKDPEDTKSDKA